MTKNDIKNDDILYFRNGEAVQYGEKKRWVLDTFYNDNLECITNEDLDIVKIVRENNKEIYVREQEQSKR